ncbi:GH25 family lysozyme [Actinacidiphila yanglinensis]|nr:GH25 family lysozyme [Actinacidiphila yanglinensis]
MAVGVLGASVALTATMTAGTATASTLSAQKLPKGSTIPLGDGYMGVGYVQDSKNFTADSRKLMLDAAGLVSPNFASNPPPGIDVSHYQGTINWSSVKSAGIQFAYIKATEGTTYKDPTFNANYLNAYNAGVIRGAYHFAQPGSSSGASQANYFASNGGAWSADNLTLPGMLDLEGGCYGLSAASMQSWILDFYNTYKSRTGRDVLIYTSASWWSSCTGSWSGMSARSPLVAASWTSAADPTIPSGFPYATIWQYTDAGSVSGISGAVDRDRFNGDHSRILALANNTA